MNDSILGDLRAPNTDTAEVRTLKAEALREAADVYATQHPGSLNPSLWLREFAQVVEAGN